MDEAFDSFLNLDEHTEVRNRADLAVYSRVERIALRYRVPRIGAELLHAEAHALVLDVDTQHDRLELVALLDHFRRMPNFLRPRQIRDVHQAVDARFDFDEHAEISDRFNF